MACDKKSLFHTIFVECSVEKLEEFWDDPDLNFGEAIDSHDVILKFKL